MAQLEFYIFVEDGKLMVRYPAVTRGGVEPKRLKEIKTTNIIGFVRDTLRYFKSDNMYKEMFSFFLLPSARRIIGKEESDRISEECVHLVNEYNAWARSV